MVALSATAAVPTDNNVALVSGQSGGTITGPAGGSITESFAMPGNVTSGNVVMVGVNYFCSSAYTFNLADITKSGTATIGTVVLDAAFSPGNTRSGSAIFRVPITGTGSLTIIFTRNGASSGFIQIGCAEFSGMNASPLDAASTNNGTGTDHTTGSLTTSVPGMIFYSASEVASSNFVRTISDTTVRNDQSGSNDFTGLIQFKRISTSPNTLTDTTGADSSAWQVAYGKYKTS